MFITRRVRYLLLLLAGGFIVVSLLLLYSCQSTVTVVNTSSTPTPHRSVQRRPDATGTLHASSFPAAGSYVSADEASVAFLQWESKSGSLSGTYSIAIADGTTRQEAMAGEVQGVRARFILASDTLSASVDGSMLRTQALSNNQATRTWYPATQDDYPKLRAAFLPYLQTLPYRNKLFSILQTPPQDSDPHYFQQQLRASGQYIENEQTQLRQIQAANSATACPMVRSFQITYPTHVDPAQLPYSRPQDTSYQAVVDRSSLSQAISALQLHWGKARLLPLPRIAGLTAPWLVSSDKLVADGEMRLGQLQNTVLGMVNLLQLLERQHQAIQHEIQQRAAQC